MKIAYLSPTFPPILGGMGTACYYTANVIGKSYKVTIFLANRGIEYQKGNYEIKLIKPWLCYGHGHLMPQVLWRLNGFDIIHLYYPYFGVAEFLYLLKKIKGKKAPKIIFHYQMDMVGQGITRIINWLHKKIIASFLFKTVDMIFVLSDDYAQHSAIKRYYFYYPEKFKVIPNGVDIERFRPSFCHPERNVSEAEGPVNDEGVMSKARDNSQTDSPASLTPLCSVHLGRNDKKENFIIFTAQVLDKQHFFKGIDVLIKAVKNLNEHNGILWDPFGRLRAGSSPLSKFGAQDDFFLIIAGGGNLKEYYQDLSQELGIADRVKFLGQINHGDLPRYYQMADVVVVPSTQKTESFSITAVEAMASGKPVIVSDLPGLRVTAENGISGLLVKPGDVNDLVKKIFYLCQNRKLLGKMGLAARERAERKYNWKEICKRIVNYYYI